MVVRLARPRHIGMTCHIYSEYHYIPREGLGITCAGPNIEVISSPSGGTLSGCVAKKLKCQIIHTVKMLFTTYNTNVYYCGCASFMLSHLSVIMVIYGKTPHFKNQISITPFWGGSFNTLRMVPDIKTFFDRLPTTSQKSLTLEGHPKFDLGRSNFFERLWVICQKRF